MNVSQYLEIASKNLVPSDTPSTSQELFAELKKLSVIPEEEKLCGMLGAAISQLKVKWSYRYTDRNPESDNYYPKKTKQYFLSVSVGNGNLQIDKPKMYRRRAKAKKARLNAFKRY